MVQCAGGGHPVPSSGHRSPRYRAPFNLDQLRMGGTVATTHAEVVAVVVAVVFPW